MMGQVLARRYAYGLESRGLKLLDFGTATQSGVASMDAIVDGDALTSAGVVVGTLQYMAPEQARGARTFDTRMDVYACGLVIYEMLTGSHPFQGLDAQHLAEAVAFQSPLSLARVAPSVPLAVARAIDLALANDRSTRHEDARAFHAALRAAEVSSGDAATPFVNDWDAPTKPRPPHRVG